MKEGLAVELRVVILFDTKQIGYRLGCFIRA